MVILIILACVWILFAIGLVVGSFYLAVVKGKEENNLVNIAAVVTSLSAMLASIAVYFK